MGTPYFTDEKHRPTEKDIVSVLGRTAGAWRALFDQLHAEHPDIAAVWNYYADGKSWLLKATRKSKTVFWLSVEKGAFRVSFYFPTRLLDAVLASGLSKERQADVRSRAHPGKLFAVTIPFGARRGISDVLTLISLKSSLK